MCDFAHPAFLLLALLVPLLVWRWLRQRPGALLYPDTGWLAGLPAGRNQWARWGGAGLRAGALLFLVIALAGPRWPDSGTRLPTEGIAIVMLVDVSGSMAEPDFDWHGQPISRLEAVKKVFHLFVEGGEGPNGETLEGRADDLIGLVTFATWPHSACPLTLSHAVLLRLLDAEQPRSVPTESRTNISDAIVWGLHRLDNAQNGRKVLVLLSDGEHNVPESPVTPRQAAQLAANRRVPIYTIDAGGETESALEAGVEERKSELDTQAAAKIRVEGMRMLQAVATITGGKSFQARDTATLLAVCREIDRLERREIQSFQYRRYFEGFPWVGLAGLACWVLVKVLEMTWWLRIP